MKLYDLISALANIQVRTEENIEINGISYDSRKTKQGDLFVAITGFESDGHSYIEKAIENGAVAVVGMKECNCPVPYIQVENSRQALALLSQRFFGDPGAQMQLIGVTGTNGKTTTTLLIKDMIEQCFGVKAGLIGTNGNMIGSVFLESERTTPESYELQKLLYDMKEAGCTYVVMEVSSHSLVLDRVAGLNFTAGIFTNLTQDHLDFHIDMDGYASAKAGLFCQSTVGAVNADDPYAAYMTEAAQCKLITYSQQNPSADLYAKNISLCREHVTFTLVMDQVEQEVCLHIPGRFSVYNALSVLSCARILQIPMDAAAKFLAQANGVKGRVESVPTHGDYSIIIDYAHTPDALENVLQSMQEVSNGRVVAVFGCGGDRDRTKRPQMGKIAAACADFVIVTSDNPRTEAPEDIIQDVLQGMQNTTTPYVVIEDRKEAICYAIDHHEPGDVIVLAGKGHETYQILGQTKIHMDEREIVAAHLSKRNK